MGIERMEEEWERLKATSRSRTLKNRLVLRAQIILLVAQGLSNRSMGRELAIDYRTAMRWWNHLIAQRFEGIEHERVVRGQRSWIQHEEVREVAQKTLRTKPEGVTHWNLRRMALS